MFTKISHLIQLESQTFSDYFSNLFKQEAKDKPHLSQSEVFSIIKRYSIFPEYITQFETMKRILQRDGRYWNKSPDKTKEVYMLKDFIRLFKIFERIGTSNGKGSIMQYMKQQKQQIIEKELRKKKDNKELIVLQPASKIKDALNAKLKETIIESMKNQKNLKASQRSDKNKQYQLKIRKGLTKERSSSKKHNQSLDHIEIPSILQPISLNKYRRNSLIEVSRTDLKLPPISTLRNMEQDDSSNTEANITKQPQGYFYKQRLSNRIYQSSIQKLLDHCQEQTSLDVVQEQLLNKNYIVNDNSIQPSRNLSQQPSQQHIKTESVSQSRNSGIMRHKKKNFSFTENANLAKYGLKGIPKHNFKRRHMNNDLELDYSCNADLSYEMEC